MADLIALTPLIARAQLSIPSEYLASYLAGPVSTTVDLIREGLETDTSVLLIRGDPAEAFCWAEIMRETKDLLVHQIYTSPGYPFGSMWQAIGDLAKRRGCLCIIALAHQPALERLLHHRYGFERLATLMKRGVA